jgi:hypothetical protein
MVWDATKRLSGCGLAMIPFFIAEHPNIAEVVASLIVTAAFALPVIGLTRVFAFVHERMRERSEQFPASVSAT